MPAGLVGSHCRDKRSLSKRLAHSPLSRKLPRHQGMAPCAASSSPRDRDRLVHRQQCRRGVEASLRAGKSGIVFAPTMPKRLSAAASTASPTSCSRTTSTSANLRFMGDGAAYTFIAMDQAVKDFRPFRGPDLERPDRHHRRIWRSVDEIVLQGPQHRPRNRVNQKDRPVRRDQGHVLDRLGCLAHLQIKGRPIIRSLRPARPAPLHRQRDRADPDGQTGHRLRRRRRGAGLDALLPLRRDGRNVVQYNDTPERASRTL